MSTLCQQARVSCGKYCMHKLQLIYLICTVSCICLTFLNRINEITMICYRECTATSSPYRAHLINRPQYTYIAKRREKVSRRELKSISYCIGTSYNMHKWLKQARLVIVIAR